MVVGEGMETVVVTMSDLQNLLFIPGDMKYTDIDVWLSVDSLRRALSNGVCYVIVGQSTVELRTAKLSP